MIVVVVAVLLLQHHAVDDACARGGSSGTHSGGGNGGSSIGTGIRKKSTSSRVEQEQHQQKQQPELSCIVVVLRGYLRRNSKQKLQLWKMPIVSPIRPKPKALWSNIVKSKVTALCSLSAIGIWGSWVQGSSWPGSIQGLSNSNSHNRPQQPCRDIPWWHSAAAAPGKRSPVRVDTPSLRHSIIQ